MRFVTLDQAAEYIRGKRVAVVGSGPSVLDQGARPATVDSRDVVVRVSNYKTGPAQGYRTDVFYSFFGTSIRKTAEDLKRDGVKLCMCKCPNSKPIQCEWHETRNKQLGIDFRYIYKNRAGWWFCDTYIPDDEAFISKFRTLGNHIPTTGFAAILDVLDLNPASVYLTGFDFFASGVHNVDEKWRPGDPGDPIGHRPDLEREWVKANAHRFQLDQALQGIVA